MRGQFSAVSLPSLIAAGLLTALPLQANAQWAAFATANNANNVEAGCLVGTGATEQAVAICLCQANGDLFSFCQDFTYTEVEAAAIGVGQAAGQADTGLNLQVNVDTWGRRNDIKIDISGSCTLQESMFIELIDNTAENQIQGATMRYAAIYMWPVVTNRSTGDQWSGNPVRLCARGTDTTLFAVTNIPTSPSSNYLWATTDEDLGMAGAFSWVAPKRPFARHGYNVEAHFMLVGRVGQELIQYYGDDFTSIGFNTTSMLKDRSLSVAVDNIAVTP